MSQRTITIEQNKVDALRKREESHFFDFKSKRIEPGKLSRTACAFANADGGEIYVGIEDPAKGTSWDGFDQIEDANPIFQVLQKIFPMNTGIQLEFLEAANHPGKVLKIDVHKSADVKKATDGEVYIRRSAQNFKLDTREDLERLELNKGLRSHEDSTLQYDLSEISNSKAVIEFMLDVVPDAEPERWLKKQRLIVDGLPTVAGALLFSDEPQVVLPKAAVKIYHYKTSDKEGTRTTLEFDPIAIEGSLYKQIYSTVHKVVDIAGNIPVVGATGLEKVEYPPVAIHEIVTNAVLHRDYSLNDDIHVRIFDNRIEVESPGILPAHITEKNILDERFARNSKIVRLINKHKNPPNKDVGEGLNTSFQAMRELKLREPQIIQRNNSVLVILKHERLGSYEEIIVNHLKTNDEINNSRARELCAVGDANKMKRIFQGMMKAEIITRIEGRSQAKAAYKKGPNFPKE